ncbi:hypothetical protein PSPO01_00939 [Paraphaeosphaeria sporulosa]
MIGCNVATSRPSQQTHRPDILDDSIAQCTIKQKVPNARAHSYDINSRVLQNRNAYNSHGGKGLFVWKEFSAVYISGVDFYTFSLAHVIEGLWFSFSAFNNYFD